MTARFDMETTMNSVPANTTLALLAAFGIADPNAMTVDEVIAEAEKLYGRTQEPDAQKAAVALFHNAFDRGDRMRAGYRLGTAYVTGTGTARDIETAVKFFDLPELDRTRFAHFLPRRHPRHDSIFRL